MVEFGISFLRDCLRDQGKILGAHCLLEVVTWSGLVLLVFHRGEEVYAVLNTALPRVGGLDVADVARDVPGKGELLPFRLPRDSKIGISGNAVIHLDEIRPHSL